MQFQAYFEGAIAPSSGSARRFSLCLSLAELDPSLVVVAPSADPRAVGAVVLPLKA